jgi:2'-5' RNA ligase
MSGIYLAVWDDAKYDAVLAMTKGGSPHITLAYTGKSVSAPLLYEIASQVCRGEIVCPRYFVLTRAYVNSFKMFNGVMRHDVLVELSHQFEDVIAHVNSELAKYRYNNTRTTEPHVTVAICNTLEEAIKRVDEVNALLPRQIKVTGFTID